MGRGMHTKNIGQVRWGRMLTTEGRPVCARVAPGRQERGACTGLMEGSGIGVRGSNLSLEGRLAWADAAQRTIEGRRERPGTLTHRTEDRQRVAGDTN